MTDVAQIAGLSALWEQTLGDPQIRVAVVDGPIDTSHQAFDGATLERAEDAWPEEGWDGAMASHGTAVASILFGQHHGPVAGLCPGCHGLSSPAFSDRRRRQSELELARAIEAAVESGAHVINISGGQLTPSANATELLDRAVRMCHERNVLVVAAAGNDGCLCDHVPAALPSALAVGALGDDGEPLPMSNWGRSYRDHGLLAPGENILVAVAGGGTARLSGTSLATPIVSGVAALLLSLQVRAGLEPDPRFVREALLLSADPCELDDPHACERFLTGKLNIERAVSVVMSNATEVADMPVVSCGCEDLPCACGTQAVLETDQTVTDQELTVAAATVPCAAGQAGAMSSAAGTLTPPRPQSAPEDRGFTPSAEASGLVYALGTLDYDFGSEARRDSFKVAMTAWNDRRDPPPPTTGSPLAKPPVQPYDRVQMVGYLEDNPTEAKRLIWTLNLELTPIYAIEPVGPYAAEVYARLRELLRREFLDPGKPGEDVTTALVERIGVPARKTDRTVKLFSGQVVPVIEVEQTRGVVGWSIDSLLQQLDPGQTLSAAEASKVEGGVREFLVRIYYDLRNLGATSRDRALNYAATDIFQFGGVAAALKGEMALDYIDVEKSPMCRMDSDCWDVKLRFFDPENNQRARQVFRFAVDVSDLIPVMVGELRTWKEAS
jgi:cyanobactin maturation PatA/PatG family protease